ncbi:MAG: ATPase domain-containing protein [Candidatus Hydrothermarchaeales archaeon]
MIETGIPKLDDFLQGGIPEGKTICYYIQPGVEGDVFGMQTLINNLERGGRGIFITSTMDPQIIREYFKEYGWELEKYGDRFEILDAYSGLMGIKSNEKYVVEDPSNIESFDKTIRQVLKDFSGGGVVFGSLSAIMDICGEEKTLEYIEQWNRQVLLNDVVGIYNFTAWPYSEEVIKKVKEELFNAVIQVGGIGERVIFGQYYGVIKTDWSDAEGRCVLFRLVKPGGIRAFIPKLLVTGPFNAGKSTFVHELSTRSVSVDRLGTTVAMDHGHVDHKGFSVDIFGTPGQERFDPIIKLLGKEALGLFLIIDSTVPQEFARAKKMLELTKGYGLPFIVVANKQDIKGALSIDEIKKKMNVGEKVIIMPAVATEKKGILEAFERMIDMVTEAD